MVILTLIALILSWWCGLKWVINFRASDGYEGGLGWSTGFFVFGSIWFVTALASLNLNLSTNNLTGYIYASETRFGYIHGHIRFSEQAGQDVQPSFCVKADSEAGRQIKELTGSGKKVVITEPPYFYLSNNPFACGTTAMKIEVQD